jgi:hypothetical protein
MRELFVAFDRGCERRFVVSMAHPVAGLRHSPEGRRAVGLAGPRTHDVGMRARRRRTEETNIELCIRTVVAATRWPGEDTCAPKR